MTPIVKTTGFREAEKALLEMSRATSMNVARRTLKEAGEPVAEKARELAPVEDGALRESITVGTKLTRRQRKLKRSGVEMHIGPGPLPQAITQEFGTWFHRAQAFMRPAWESLQDKVLETIKDLLWVHIKKATDRAARRAARRR